MKMSNAALAPAAILLLVGAGCERGTSGLGPTPMDTNPIVFEDGFQDGVIFHAFLGSKLDAGALDTEQRYEGSASARVTVPGPGDDTGGYAGGAFTAGMERDLSGYNALTFWAKARRDLTLDTAGLANDNTGTSRFIAEWKGAAVTTQWAKYVVPIPIPAKLSAERGLFFFAEGEEDGAENDIWFDSIRFEHLDTISDPRPTLSPVTTSAFVGQSIELGNTTTRFNVDGVDQTIEHMPAYFTFTSSDDAVARVTEGEIRITGVGTARITAKLGEIEAGGAVTVDATAPPMGPAPVPTHPAASVISLFSDAYPDWTVDTWSPPWDRADVIDFTVAGDAVKAYPDLYIFGNFAVAVFEESPVDASEMTHLHMDVWAPDFQGLASFPLIQVKLVDFGPNGRPEIGEDGRPLPGSDDTVSPEVGRITATQEWFSVDIPLVGDDPIPFATFGLEERAHLGQLVLFANASVLYIDNVYFYAEE